ncbi:MAG: SURF1 family protein [Nocardioidaceae bacterium]
MTIRQLFTWRALGLGVLALVLIAAMVVLGLWQLGVYDDQQHDNAQSQLARPPVPLDEVLGPDDAFPGSGVARPVTVSGHYLPGEQFEVRDGATLGVARAVVTPLATATGSVVLVVRGQGDPETATSPPQGSVTVTGVLEPSDASGSGLDATRTTDGIRIATLVQYFDRDLYGGYVVRTSSRPVDSLTPVAPPFPQPSRWAGIRNLLYAIQWWVFGGFVAFMWWRIVTELPGPPGAELDGLSVVTPDADTDEEPSRSVG